MTSFRPPALPTIAVLACGLIVACDESDLPDDALDHVRPPELARITPAGEALDGANIPTLDPHTMNDAEIRKALQAGRRCEFRYTATGSPVLAIAADPNGNSADAVVKLNGHLVLLERAPDTAAPVLRAERIRLRVTPDGGWPDMPGTEKRIPANLVFEVENRLKVGYRGYLNCLDDPYGRTGPATAAGAR